MWDIWYDDGEVSGWNHSFFYWYDAVAYALWGNQNNGKKLYSVRKSRGEIDCSGQYVLE